jgi:hypothetical protein
MKPSFFIRGNLCNVCQGTSKAANYDPTALYVVPVRGCRSKVETEHQERSTLISILQRVPMFIHG